MSNFMIVLAVAFVAQFAGFDSRGVIDVVNILSWPLGFFVSYRLWPPKRRIAPPPDGEQPPPPERKTRPRWPWVVAAFGCIVMTIIFFVWLAASLRQTDDGWQTVRAPDGSFSVLMPGTPEHEQTGATSLAFGKVRVNMLMLEQGQWGYSVSWVDYPTGSYAGADLDASLDQARDGAVEGVQGTLLGEEHVTIQGYPGRHMRVAPNDVHVENMAELVKILETRGTRDRFILIVGGPHITHKLAQESGFDAGFGRGTYAEHVATFVAKRIVEKGSK